MAIVAVQYLPVEHPGEFEIIDIDSPTRYLVNLDGSWSALSNMQKIGHDFLL